MDKATPWTHDPRPDFNRWGEAEVSIHHVMSDDEAKLIATIFGESSKQALERAVRIVTAVNCFDPLDKLAGEIKGCWSGFELELRQVIGNTNYQIVADLLKETDEALTRARKEGE